MGRSLKKGPYIDETLYGRIEELNRTRQKKVLKTWSRRSTIAPEFVGHTLAVHNGILEVSSNDDMFVTVFYGVLHLASGRLTYVRAGQDKPLMYRAAGGKPEGIASVYGPANAAKGK